VGFSLASPATWYVHRRLRDGQLPRRRRQMATPAATAPAARAVVAHAAAAPASAAPADGQGGLGAGEEGGGLGGDAAGRGETYGNMSASDPHRRTQLPNGICVPTQVISDNIDEFVAYSFVVQEYKSCRE